MGCDPVSIRIEWVILLVLDAEEAPAIEEETQENADLHEAVHQNVSPHSSVDD